MLNNIKCAITNLVFICYSTFLYIYNSILSFNYSFILFRQFLFLINLCSYILLIFSFSKFSIINTGILWATLLLSFIVEIPIFPLTIIF